MIAQIPTVLAKFDMAKLFPHIKSLTIQGEEDAAYNSLLAIFDNTDPAGIKMLTAQLCAALQTRGNYAQQGICDKIFIDTMKCFTRFILEHFGTYDRYHFDRGWWAWRQLSMRIVRLGVLEFELMKEGYISVHIPSDAVMTNDALSESYDIAKSFYTPHGSPEIRCCTWLLSPALKEILPAGSRILNFQKDYEIFELIPESNYFMRWVFNKEYGDVSGDIAQLPEDTSLQRGVKKLLLEGKTVGDARGRYIERGKL